MNRRRLKEIIQQAAEDGRSGLDLSGNQLTELPPEIGQLTNLTSLGLSSNQLRELPPEIGQLTNLTSLSLSSNQLSKLPPETVQLTNLTTLYLWGNQLSELPPEMGQLTNLTTLDLSSNQLRELPSEIVQLTNLMTLDLSSNQLSELPPEIVLLTKLEDLYFGDNPLTSPPPAIVQQGTEAVLAYLREQLEKGRPQWGSKLLIVGEGDVGKTCLLRALQGKPFDPDSETTHGIMIEPLELEHPTETDVTMKLNCWDFGGQHIYHATHQFFLTDRSLFLLVWDTRSGYEKGKLYEWMDAIQARAPESPALIIAAHIDERDADLPLADLQARYPRIAGHYKVSNKTGEGVEELKRVITDIAAELPLMGQNWPADWLDAAESIRDSEEKHVTPAELKDVMVGHGVSEDDVDTVAQYLHDLGDILYFRDDEELKNLVIIKPQWVTEYISKVLESQEVIDGAGIFTSDHMRELWVGLDPVMQSHFLRLMEQFDLSYRTLDDREISLVVELLPLNPPGYEEQWDAIRNTGNCREIAMRFRLNNIPPGIPTWFIARSHRFTTHTHWRNGALFAYDTERKHLALAQAFSHDRYIQLTVRGPNPHNFFALLKDGIELTLARFPGLEIKRMIPCPGHNGEPCDYEFNYAHLEIAIERDPPIEKVTCMPSFEDVLVSDLLFGIHWSTQDAVLERIDELEATLVGKDDAILSTLRDLLELSQREFTNIYRREQSKIDSHCPNVFVMRPRNTSLWREKIIGEDIELQLCCQYPGHWHLQGTPYVMKSPAKWISATAPYLQKMVAVLKYAAPLVDPGAGMASSQYAEMFKNDLKLMTELVKKLPDLKADRGLELLEDIGEIRGQRGFEGAELRAVRQLLDELDPDHHWGGLKKTLTPEGHYLWLCEQHAEKYRV